MAKTITVFGIALLLTVGLAFAFTDNSTAYYQFENNLLEDINNTHLGITSGTPSYNTGKVGQAVECTSGDTDRFDNNSVPSPGITRTIDVWANFSALGASEQIVFHLADDADSYVQLYYRPATGNITVLNYHNGDSDLHTAQAPTLNIWNHVVITFSNSDGLKIYQDGELQTTNTGDNKLPLESFDALTLCDTQAGGVFMNGQIDNLYFSGTEYNQADVTYSYNAGDGIDLVSGGGGSLDTINLSVPNPINESQFNIDQLDVNITVNASVNFNCSLYVNGTLNQTHNQYGNGTDVFVNFTLYFDSNTEADYEYYFQCDDNQTADNSTNSTFHIDNVNPTSQVSASLSTPQVSYGSSNITGQFNFSDVNLWGINITINNEITLFNITNISSTSYQYNLSFDPSLLSLTPGLNTIAVYYSDSHTAKWIPKYGVAKGLFDKSLKYSFPEGGWIKVTPKKGVLFSNFDTWKKPDRYVFQYERDPVQRFLLGDEMVFDVTSSDGLEVAYTNYKGHIVSTSLAKWLDFESQFPDAEVQTEKLDFNKIRVTINGIDENLVLFNSIGGLNVVNQNYSFFYGNTTETYVNQTLETGSNLFTLNFSINQSYVSDISALFYYNDTEYTPTKVNTTDYIYFSHSVGSQLLGTENTSNITFYWDYNITNLDAGNISNQTIHTNQTVYKMIVSNCSGATVVNKTLNFTILNQSNNAEVNTTAEALFTVWNQSTELNRNWSMSEGSQQYHAYCIFPEWASINSDYEVKFTSTGYANRNYFVEDGELNNTLTHITLYTSTTGIATEITITVVDENDNELSGYIVEAHRYDLGTNSYVLIDTKETSSVGVGVFNLDVSTDEYQFRIKNAAGTTVYTEPKQLLTETAYTFRVVLGTTPESTLIGLQNLDFSLYADKNTNTFTLTWDDSETNLIQSMNFTVVMVNTSANVFLDSTTSTANADTLTYNYSQSGIYIAYAFANATNDNKMYLLKTATLDIREEWDLFGTDALVMTLLFVGTICFLGFATERGPEIGIVLSIFGMIIFYALGFVKLGLAGLISLIVAFIILLIQVKRR